MRISSSIFSGRAMAPPQRRVQVSLRTVTPSIPERGLERAQLEEDLRRMRCARLLERPWRLKQEEIFRELLATKRPNIFDGTIRDRPQLWIANLWRDVYHFPEGWAGLANRMDSYIEGRFVHQVDPKDNYPVRDYWNDRQHRVLEFLVPIIHSDKPTQVTITIGNTIFGALDGGKLEDWGVVFRNLAQRLAKRVGKPKPTPICPFLFHLYDSQVLLTKKEDLDYKTTHELARHRITFEPDSRPESEDKGQANIPAASPIQEEPLPTPNRRRKQTFEIATCSVKRRGEPAPTEGSTTGRVSSIGASSTGATPTGTVGGAARGGLGVGLETLR